MYKRYYRVTVVTKGLQENLNRQRTRMRDRIKILVEEELSTPTLEVQNVWKGLYNEIN